MKASVFIATSLDGFIARNNGDLDWLTDSETFPEDEDYGYQSFMDSIDAVVMGRHTFEKVLSFDQWHYSKKVVVLTSKNLEIPDHLSGKVTMMSGAPKEITDQLADYEYHHLYIDGGKTIQQFLRAGLIDEMIISRIPKLIGDGIPLFGPLEEDITLELISTKTYDGGMVQNKYKVLSRNS